MKKQNSSKLNEISEIKVGYQVKTRIHEDRNGSYSLIQGRDIDNSLQLNTQNLIHFSPEAEIDNFLLKKGDILFQARGSENYACLIQNELTNTIAAGSFYFIRIIHPEVHPVFLTWWLNLPRVQKSFQSVRSGTLISYVSLGVLGEIEVPIPPYQIQERIARINQLWNKETKLVDNLIKSRNSLVQAACKNSIKKSIKRNIHRVEGGPK